MRAWFAFVLRHRAGVLLVLGLLTALAAASASRGVLSSSLQQLFFGESPEYAAWLDEARRFGTAEVLVVGYRDPDPLSPESLDRLERATAAIAALPDIHDTISLLDAPRIAGGDGLLRVESWADAARAAPAERAALLRAAAADPRIGGVLVDRAGAEGGAIVAGLTVQPERAGEDVPAIRDGAVQAMLDAGYAREDLHLAGLPVLVGGLIDASFRNLAVLFPITCGVLLLSVLALFGRVAPAAVALGVSLVAVLWTMGFSAALDPRFSIFTAVVPAVVVIVSFSDIIHLWSAWLTELRDGRDRQEAILCSAADVGRACLLTSATTFVGFVSLSFVPTPAFRLLGVVLGFGVGVALLLAMTAVPIVLSVLPPPPPRARPRWMSGLVDAIVDASARVSTRRPRAVLAGFLVFGGVAASGLTRLRIDADFVDRFTEDSAVRQDSRWFATHFAGTDTLDVFLAFPEAGGALTAPAWAGQQALLDGLAGVAGVDHVDGLPALLDGVHAALGGAGRPGDAPTVAQELLLFETAGGAGLDRVVDFERQHSRLSVRLAGGGVRGQHRVAEQARTLARATLPPDTGVLAASLVTLLGAWLDEIIAGQRRGVLVSCLVIGAMMIAGLRSLRVGLWSMLPNLLPLLALGGFAALIWDPVDSDTLIIAMMAIGIGVDDTVHFLVRFRLESARTDDRALAIRRTFAFAGRAIVTTTLILGLGFLPLAASDYTPLRLIGTLLPAVLVVALVADLLLVPALARLGWLRFSGPGP